MKKLIAALLMTVCSTAMAYDSYMGEILGGVAGGIIGNQIGGGSGRVVTTAIGAGLGAIVGGRVEDNMNYNRYGYDSYDPYYRQPRISYNQLLYPGYRQLPRTQYQSCTAWVETVDQYGFTTRTRTCY